MAHGGDWAAPVAASVALLLCACGSGPAAAGEPRAPAAPEDIVEYRDSGEWDRDTSERIDAARASLAGALDEGTVVRPAIVLDVDDTSLSNYECLKRSNFRQSARGSCGPRGVSPAIPQTLALYRFARERGVAIFFITGRRERLRSVTRSNLRAEGYPGLHSAADAARPRAAGHRTTAGRRAPAARLTRRGYRILINVGDQRSDLTGGYARRTFKLPNPMYVIKTA